jgi:hypothetical protein
MAFDPKQDGSRTGLAVPTQAAVAPRYEATSGGLNTLAYEPTSLSEAFYMAGILVQSGLTPKAIDTPQKAFLVMAQGRELGLSTMQALNNIYVVEGRVSLSSDLMAALIVKSPVCEYLRCTEMTPERASYAAKRRGGAEFKFAYTWEDAKRAGLTNRATYQNNPADMLRHRALAKTARAVFPDIIAGLYSRDEAEDAVINVTPSAAPAAPVEVPAAAPLEQAAPKVRRRPGAASAPVAAPVLTGIPEAAPQAVVSAPTEQQEASSEAAGEVPHRAADGSVIDPLTGEVLTGTPEADLFAQAGDCGSEEGLVELQVAVTNAKLSLDPKRFAALRWLYFWSRRRVSGREAPADAQALRHIA